MTLSLANSVEDLEQGCSGCNTQSDSDSESLNDFKFTDVKDVKLMTGAPATTTSIVFKDSPYPTVGDTINIHIGKANINGKEFENFTSNNLKIPCENNERITFCNRLSRYGCVYGLVSLFIIGLLVATPFLFRTTSITRIPPFELLSPTNVTTEPLPTSNGPPKDKLVKRATWAALKVETTGQKISKQQQFMRVFVTHTGGSPCFSFEECSWELRSIQQNDMENCSLPDIRYNFLIGGDERVYEGRGWDLYEEESTDRIDVAFIGNVSQETPTTRMFIMAYFFIKCTFSEIINDPCLIAPENLEWLASKVNFCGILNSGKEYCCNTYDYCYTVGNISYSCSD